MVFGHPDTSECHHGLLYFLSLSDSLAMPVKPEKTIWPTTRIEMHSILYDSQIMAISLPPDKVKKALDLLDLVFKKTKVHTASSRVLEICMSHNTPE